MLIRWPDSRKIEVVEWYAEMLILLEENSCEAMIIIWVPIFVNETVLQRILNPYMEENYN